MLAAGVLGAIHFFLLAANTAGVISIVFCFRITAAYFYPVKWMAAVFVGGAIITSALTFAGWTSVLACLGTSTGTLASFQKDNRRMRQQFLLASGFWTAHNILVWSPIAILQEIAISSSNLLGLWRYHRKMGPLDSPPP
jgi:Kef-type K+ transport system membrane component KefB